MKNDITISNIGSQQVSKIFKFSSNFLSRDIVIGNFKENSQTNISIQSGNWTYPAMEQRPSIFLDNIELINLGSSGPKDYTVCVNTTLTLGDTVPCLDTNDFSVSWWKIGTGIVDLGETKTITFSQPGVHMWTRSITYGGLSHTDTITVTVVPEFQVLSQTPINICGNPNVQIELSDVNQNPGTFNVTMAGGTHSQFGFNGNFLDLGQVTITSPNRVATVTITKTITGASPTCVQEQVVTIVDDCCGQTTGADHSLFSGNFSSYVSGRNFTNATFSVTGSVVLDDNITFSSCTFYLNADAELIVPNGKRVSFLGSTLQECSGYKWDRVQVDAGGDLVFTNNRVFNAFRGVMTSNDNVVQFDDNIFTYCYTMLVIEGYSSPGMIQIQGNEFIGDGVIHAGLPRDPASTLPWPRPSAINYQYVTGIVVLSSQGITIGGSPANQNSFIANTSQSYSNGVEMNYILVDNSGVDISFNEFGLCYWAILTNQSNYQIHDNDFDGYRNHILSSPVGTGFWTKYSEGRFYNNLIQNYDYGVSVEDFKDTPNSAPENSIDGNTINASIGVNVGNLKSGGSTIYPGILKVFDNSISSPYKGVLITDAIYNIVADIEHVNVYYNTIVMSPQPGIECIGVDIKSSQGVRVFENEISTIGSYSPVNGDLVVGVRDFISDTWIFNHNTHTDVQGNPRADFIKGFNRAILIEGEGRGEQGAPSYTRIFCNSLENSYSGLYYKNVDYLKDVRFPGQIIGGGIGNSNNFYSSVTVRVSDNGYAPVYPRTYYWDISASNTSEDPFLLITNPVVFVGDNQGQFVNCNGNSPRRISIDPEQNTVNQEEDFCMISPNPNEGDFIVRFRESQSIEKAVLFDGAGKILAEYHHPDSNSWELHGVSKGVYYLVVIKQHLRSVEKVVVY
ncbi:MAG: T9SS type A sorting domain-containing protein [Bacteroidota bacterium]|nr:T9SS type A sorting domain-containing protein [Bacteroidota bacterium]